MPQEAIAQANRHSEVKPHSGGPLHCGDVGPARKVHENEALLSRFEVVRASSGQLQISGKFKHFTRHLHLVRVGVKQGQAIKIP
eukprot:CAMPEP_0177677550 /NCGR_PEP_ID=MMETSP0447-20121125/28460_1 /TAXON_ID=0 /ORGANISM="Stygamoeba regulata, Strain BSH-02190019" /LENGTH=83 /DNA_ID=CAMNT_0019186343 /DNA_START=673 /DNA_END=920 /DNA_ORIENTATION=+